jgi:hypothetical protein
VGVLLGNGDGTFQPAVTCDTGGYEADSVAVADVNGDGKPDLVVVNQCLSYLCTGTDGSGTVAVLLNISTPMPLVKLTPTSMNFGKATVVGTTATSQNLVFVNVANIAVSITSIGITGVNSGDFAQTNTCGTTVAPSGRCNIVVTFTPKASGTRNAMVTITDNAWVSPQMVTLIGIAADFSLTSDSPTSQTVTLGQAANYSVTVTPLDGFNQTVSLSCSGAPAQSTCTVTPDTVTLSGSSTTVDVAVVTRGATLALVRPISGSPHNPFGAWLARSGLMGIMLMTGAVIRRRHWCSRLLCMFGVACMLVIGITMPACGGGSGSTSTGGTPAGTYPLTVTGTFKAGSATLTHVTNLTLVVQ